jgi:hypothetical protein
VGDVVGRLAVVGGRLAQEMEGLQEALGVDAVAWRVSELIKYRVPLAIHDAA